MEDAGLVGGNVNLPVDDSSWIHTDWNINTDQPAVHTLTPDSTYFLELPWRLWIPRAQVDPHTILECHNRNGQRIRRFLRRFNLRSRLPQHLQPYRQQIIAVDHVTQMSPQMDKWKLEFLLPAFFTRYPEKRIIIRVT